MPRGRPKGSKNKRPYPITDAVLQARREASVKGVAARRELGYLGASSSYLSVHKAALRWMPRDRCAQQEDGTCKSGRLEHALRKDADPKLIRIEPDGKRRRYFAGPVEEGYIILCASHHWRYDHS